MNFSSYLNGEPVRNTDIVNWVTVGAYDVPTSESAPVTAVTGRQLSFWLRPYNYFDRVRPLGRSPFSSFTSNFSLAFVICALWILLTE